MQTWTHHQCCFLESLGVLGPARAASSGDQTEVDQSSLCIQVAFCPHCSPLLIWRLFLLHPLMHSGVAVLREWLANARLPDYIRSRSGLGDVWWNFQLTLQVNCHHSVSSCGEQTSRTVLWCFLWPFPFLDTVNDLSCGLGVLDALDALADCLSDGFQDLVVPQ